MRTLESARPTIMLSTHGAEVHRDCCRLLAALGYRLEPVSGQSVEQSTELICRGRQGG